MQFKTHITVAFGDTDPAGLVYFPNIFHYCHVALERLFVEVCELKYSSLVRDQNLGFPTVRSDAEFLVPIIYGDIIEVKIKSLNLGNSSLKLRYSLHRVSDEVLFAQIEQVHVAMNLSTRRSVPIPTNIRRCFESLL